MESFWSNLNKQTFCFVKEVMDWNISQSILYYWIYKLSIAMFSLPLFAHMLVFLAKPVTSLHLACGFASVWLLYTIPKSNKEENWLDMENRVRRWVLFYCNGWKFLFSANNYLKTWIESLSFSINWINFMRKIPISTSKLSE